MKQFACWEDVLPCPRTFTIEGESATNNEESQLEKARLVSLHGGGKSNGTGGTWQKQRGEGMEVEEEEEKEKEEEEEEEKEKIRGE